MKANALFSALSGFALLWFPNSLSAVVFTASPPDSSFVLRIVGLLLLLFSGYLFLVSRAVQIPARTALGIVVSDMLWVVASILLLIAEGPAFSANGNWMIVVVAAIVGALAVLQYAGLRQAPIA